MGLDCGIRVREAESHRGILCDHFGAAVMVRSAIGIKPMREYGSKRLIGCLSCRLDIAHSRAATG